MVSNICILICASLISTAATALVFSPYKDVTISLNWNTNVISTSVTGTLSPITSAVPSKLQTITLAFATGECGKENWAGIDGAKIASANVKALVAAGKKYIISTGGAAGAFTCATDAGFTTFVERYNSANLIGIDFDIEGGQSQTVIDNLVARVKAAQSKYPKLRFSFTLATLGAASGKDLGATGIAVLNTLKSKGVSNYLINLMAMDYGGPSAGVCVLGTNGKCDMGKSAVEAAKNLHTNFGVPYSQIELTPMIGGNDVTDEIFTIPDIATVATFAKENGLAGVHFWSLDRDVDCPKGAASATCNTYGDPAGKFGFTNWFITKLGL